MESRFYLTRPNFRQTNSKVRAPEYLFSPITGIVRYAFFFTEDYLGCLVSSDVLYGKINA